MAIQIVEIGNRHLDKVVDIHMRAFPTFFLTFLGPRFLRQFYKSFIYDRTGIGFVAEDIATGNVLGVIAGPLVPVGYFRRLIKKHWYVFCWACTTAILKKPSIIKRLYRAAFYRGELPPGQQRALVSSIVVSPDAQKCGVGRALMNRWLDEVRERGKGMGCYLTTDAQNNEATNSFYHKLGWNIESTYTTPEGRLMNRYFFDYAKESDLVIPKKHIEFHLFNAKYAVQVARLHVEDLPNALISTFDLDIAVALFEEIAQSNTSFGVVSEDNGKVVGFVIFTPDLLNLYKATFAKVGFRCLPVLLRKMFSLERLINLFEILLYPWQIKKMHVPKTALISLAVAKEVRGQGVGTALIQRGFDECRNRGITDVRVLVGAANQSAQSRYMKCGFRKVLELKRHQGISILFVADTRKKTSPDSYVL